jgi:hypothetical protein
MAIGAFGPWARVLAVLTYSGTDGNAGWTVVGAAAIGAMAVGLPFGLYHLYWYYQANRELKD